MRSRIFFVLFVVLLHALAPTAGAQERNEFWSKIQVSTHLGSKFSLSVDFQHRRQGDYIHHDKSLVQVPLMESARLWLGYQPSTHWGIVFSPAGFFDTRVLRSELPHYVHIKEWRSMAGASWKTQTGKISLNSRALYELSHMQFNTPEAYWRHRYRWQYGISIPVTAWAEWGVVSLTASDEFFVRTAKSYTGFDQNRLAGGVKWERKSIEVMAAYQYNIQQSEPGALHKNQLLLMMHLHI